MRIHSSTLAALSIFVLLLSACGKEEETPPEPEAPVAQVIGEQRVTLEGLSVPAVLHEENGEKLYILDYPNAEAALADASKVARDGSEIDGIATPWDDEPVHFFVQNERMAIYVGERTEVIENLELGAGKRFAGRDS